MEFRHLFIGLGSMGAQAVEAARLNLVNSGSTERVDITSIGFDLERTGEIPVPTLSLPLDEMKEVLANIDYRSHDPSGWRESIPWFPDPDCCQVDLDGLDSAGRSRPIGRLAFEVFRPIIESELRRRIERLTPEHKHESAEILVVASLMDGFGSGMIFDIAHLCRTLMSTARISLYLAVPEEPKAHDSRLRPYQNTYAALRELRMFVAYPQCFTPTWQTGSVFLRHHRLGVLDQVYCIDLPDDQLPGWEAKVAELAATLAHRCRSDVAQERRNFLAAAADADFFCRMTNTPQFIEPSLRRASCLSVPLTSFRNIEPVERVITLHWDYGTEEEDQRSNDEKGSGYSTIEGSPKELVRQSRNAVKEYMRRINAFLRSEDAVPPLHDWVDRWKRVFAEVEPASVDTTRLDLLDDSQRRIGHLFFSPNELKPEDRANLIEVDLQASAAERELHDRATEFMDEAKYWGTERQLVTAFSGKFNQMKEELEKRPSQRPGYHRLRELWEEINRFDGWLTASAHGTRDEPDATPLVRGRNRELRLEILSKASQELNDYQVTRNLLRLEAVGRVLQKLRGMVTTEPGENEAHNGGNTSNGRLETADLSLTSPPRADSTPEDRLLLKLAEAVEYWRNPEKNPEPAGFVDRLRERYEQEGRLLLYLPPKGFRSALEDAFHSFVDSSPFVTRVAPGTRQNSQSDSTLIVLSLPSAFFWYRGDNHLKDFIHEVASSVLGHTTIHISRVAGLSRIWIYFEEIGRPLHQLAGMVDFRAAYESLERSGKQSLATLHIDRSLVEHFPSWPASKGPEPTACPDLRQEQTQRTDSGSVAPRTRRSHEAGRQKPEELEPNETETPLRKLGEED